MLFQRDSVEVKKVFSKTFDGMGNGWKTDNIATPIYKKYIC